MRQMRKMLQVAGAVLLLVSSTTTALADELPFDPMAEAEEAVLGEQAESAIAAQVRARSELLRELDYILGQAESDEAVLGEQARPDGPAADVLADAVRTRIELLDELDRVSGAE